MAERLRAAIEERCAHEWQAETVDDSSQVGGGSLPGENLPTTCVRIRSRRGRSAACTAAALRRSDPPIFARKKDDWVLMDPRTMEEEELTQIAHALARIESERTDALDPRHHPNQ